MLERVARTLRSVVGNRLYEVNHGAINDQLPFAGANRDYPSAVLLIIIVTKEGSRSRRELWISPLHIEYFHERIRVKGEVPDGGCPHFHSYSPGGEAIRNRRTQGRMGFLRGPASTSALC